MPAPNRPLPGTTPPARGVGRYQLRSRIASGGMASVYLGVATGAGGFERAVAVKVCHPHLRGDDEFAQMFLAEARLAAQIHHPNVVATLDVGEGGDLMYLVMEYIEGQRLSDVIRASLRAGEPLPVGVTLRIMLDTLAGLQAAHELRGKKGEPLGLIHRDVSPQNILVGLDGVARLTDFGIAKAADASVVTRSGQVKGKLGYMAPEQFAMQEPTQRVDVFAAGVVLWEALAGTRLFSGRNDGETTHRVLHLAVPPPSSVRPGVPSRLDAVVLKALARDPNERFASAQAFAEALEACGADAAPVRTVARVVDTLVGDEVRALRARLNEPADVESWVQSAAGSGSKPGDVASNVLTVAPAEPPALTRSRRAAPTAGRARGAWVAGGVALAVVLGAVLLRALVPGTVKNTPGGRVDTPPPGRTVAPVPPPAAPTPPPAAPAPAPAPAPDRYPDAGAPSDTAATAARRSAPPRRVHRTAHHGGGGGGGGGEWVPPGQ